MSFFSLNFVSESNCNARRKSLWPEFRTTHIQKSSSCIAARRNKSQVKKLYYYHLLSFSSVVVVVKLSSVCCVLVVLIHPLNLCLMLLSFSLSLARSHRLNAGRACTSPCNQTSRILFSGLLHGVVLPCVLPDRIASWYGSSTCAAWQDCFLVWFFFHVCSLTGLLSLVWFFHVCCPDRIYFLVYVNLPPPPPPLLVPQFLPLVTTMIWYNSSTLPPNLWTTHTFPISQVPTNCTCRPIKGRGRV